MSELDRVSYTIHTRGADGRYVQTGDACFVAGDAVARAFGLSRSTASEIRDNNGRLMATVEGCVISLTDDATEEIVRASVAL